MNVCKSDDENENENGNEKPSRPVNATNTENTVFHDIVRAIFVPFRENKQSLLPEDNVARERSHERVGLAPGRLVKRKYYFYTALFVPPFANPTLSFAVFLHPSPQADHPSLYNHPSGVIHPRCLGITVSSCVQRLFLKRGGTTAATPFYTYVPRVLRSRLRGLDLSKALVVTVAAGRDSCF